MTDVIEPQDRARIQVHGAGQTGTELRVISDRDCTIWFSQIIYLQDCHAINPVTGQDAGLDRAVFVAYTLELKAGEPGVLRLGNPILVEGQYRNTVAPPADGALLLSSGDCWPGYEAPWMQRLALAQMPVTDERPQ